MYSLPRSVQKSKSERGQLLHYYSNSRTP